MGVIYDCFIARLWFNACVLASCFTSHTDLTCHTLALQGKDMQAAKNRTSQASPAWPGDNCPGYNCPVIDNCRVSRYNYWGDNCPVAYNCPQSRRQVSGVLLSRLSCWQLPACRCINSLILLWFNIRCPKFLASEKWILMMELHPGQS